MPELEKILADHDERIRQINSPWPDLVAAMLTVAFIGACIYFKEYIALMVAVVHG